MPVAQGHMGAEVVGLPARSRSPTCALNCREAKQAIRPAGQQGRVKMSSTWHLPLSLFSFHEGRGGCKEGKKRRNKKRKKFPSGGKCIHPEFSLCPYLRRPASTFAQLGDTLGLSLSGARHRGAASASISLHSPFPIPITVNIFILP